MSDSDDHTTDGQDERSQFRLRFGRSILRERAFFHGLLVVLALLTLLLLLPSLSAILLAVAVVIITKPLYDWFLAKKWVRGKTSWAIGLTIVTSIVVVVVPLILIMNLAVNQASNFVVNLREWTSTSSVEDWMANVRELAEAVANGETLNTEQETLAQALGDLKETLGMWVATAFAWIGEFLSGFLIDSVVVLVIVMVMLPGYRQPDRSSLAALVPFPEPITEMYLDKIQMMITAMFRGTLVIAIAQGFAMGLVLWIAGFPNAVFLGLISMVLSVLPVIGVALVAWPAAILLLIAGQVWQAIFVIAMLVLVIGNIDAILRPHLVPKGAYLNPALLILSVFGGLRLMGIVGALYGPVIMILLVTSLEVYTKYILRSDLEPFLDENGDLDLKKLGLVSGTETLDKSQSGIVSVANNLLARVLSSPANTPES